MKHDQISKSTAEAQRILIKRILPGITASKFIKILGNLRKLGPLDPVVANEVLDTNPTAVNTLASYRAIDILVADSASFEKVTFLFNFSDFVYSIARSHDMGMVFTAACRACPEAAEKHLSFYGLVISFRDLMEATKYIDLTALSLDGLIDRLTPDVSKVKAKNFILNARIRAIPNIDEVKPVNRKLILALNQALESRKVP